jgi:hypothetical protein
MSEKMKSEESSAIVGWEVIDGTKQMNSGNNEVKVLKT